MRLRLISKREKILFFSAFFIIVFMLILNLVLVPGFNQYQSLNEKIIKAKLDLQKGYRLLKDKKQIEETYNLFFAGEDKRKSDDQIVYDILDEIQKVTKKARINLTDIKPQGSKKFRGYSVIPIELKAEGSIVEITKFLFYLQTSPSFIKIETFQIAPKSSTSSTLELRLSLNKFTF